MGKYGFSDMDGNIIIDCQFDEVKYFRNRGFAFVKEDDFWGIVDSTGNYISKIHKGQRPPEHHKVYANNHYEYHDFLFQLYIPSEKKWGLLNLKTNSFSGFCYYFKGTFSALPKRRKVLEHFKRPSMIQFKMEYHIVEKGLNKYNAINKNGDEIFKEDFELIKEISPNRMAIYKKGSGALASAKGELITHFAFLNFRKLKNESIIVSNHGLKINETFGNQKKENIIEKAGIIDTSGKIFIDTIYESLYPFFDTGYIAIKKGKYGFINLEGDNLVPFIYDKLYKINAEILKATIDGHSGIIDLNGKILIPLEYNRISYNEESKEYNFENGTKYGIINKNKEIIVQTIWGWVNRLEGDSTKYLFSHRGKKGLMNKNGEIFIPAQFDYFALLEFPYYLIKSNKKYGVLNIDTKEIIVEIKYNRIYKMENDLGDVYVLSENKSYMTTDLHFRPLLDQPVKHQIYRKDPIYVISDNQTKKRGLTNYYGKILRAPVYKKLEVFMIEKDSSLIAKIECDDYIEIVDKKGQPIFPKGFGIWKKANNWYPYMTDEKDLFKVTSENKCGIINHKGEWVIPPNYREIHKFSKELILLEDSVGVHMFNGKGKKITEDTYDFISSNCYSNRKRVSLRIPGSKYKITNFDGCCDDPTDTIRFRYKYGFIDCDKYELAVDIEYESLSNFSHKTGLAIGKKGIIDSNITSYVIDTTGAIVMESKHNILSQTPGGHYIIGNEIKGLIDSSNNIIIPQEWVIFNHAAGKYFYSGKKNNSYYLINIKSGVQFGPFKKRIEIKEWQNDTYFLKTENKTIWIDKLGKILKEFYFTEYKNKNIPNIDRKFIEVNSPNGKYLINLNNRVIYKTPD